MLNFLYVSPIKAKINFDDDSRKEFDFLREQFKTENKASLFMKQYRFSMNPFIYVISPLGSYNIGITFDLLKKCKELNIKYIIDKKLLDEINPSLHVDNILDVPNKKFKYRDYQKKFVETLCKNGRGVILSPTRSGKSLVLGGLIHNVFQTYLDNKIQNILLLVPNINLVFQMKDDLDEYGLGTYYNLQMFTSKTMSKKSAKVIIDKFNVYIANSQYLLLHGDELPYIDMIIVDECHQMTKGSEISKIVKNIKISHKFGCTGTLPKNIIDTWNISGLFGPVLDEVKIQTLQSRKILADVKIYPICFKHLHKVNFKDYSQIDYENLSKDEIQDKKFEIAQKAYKKESMYLGCHEESNKIVMNLCKNLINTNKHWNALVLFDYTAQGEQLYKLLDFENKHYVDGSIDVLDRKDIIEQMNSPDGGHITIAQSKTFSTGLTIKNIRAIFIITNQSSCTKIIQSIGRGLRREEKNTLVVFDIFHNYSYSLKHFHERTNLYKESYSLELDKDYKIKEVQI